MRKQGLKPSIELKIMPNRKIGAWQVFRCHSIFEEIDGNDFVLIPVKTFNSLISAFDALSKMEEPKCKDEQ